MSRPVPPSFATRRLGAACVSDLVLDRLAVGELDATGAATARAHLEECAGCTRAFALIEADARRFEAEVDVRAMAARLAAADGERSSPLAWLRGWRRRWPRSTAAAPAFAAIAIAVVGLSASRDSDGIRTKGPGLSVAAYVLTDGAGVPYAGAPLAAGDRVAFRLTTRQAGYVTIVGFDDRGGASQFYPPSDAAERVEAGQDVALRTAVELDDAPGREVIVAVRCNDPVAPARVLDLARASAAHRSNAPAWNELDAGCVEARMTLAKASPPPR